jgi:hypothetical protein
MARGYQWPDPWLSLNPNFASGGTITDLITEGLLQPDLLEVSGWHTERALRDCCALDALGAVVAGR